MRMLEALVKNLFHNAIIARLFLFVFMQVCACTCDDHLDPDTYNWNFSESVFVDSHPTESDTFVYFGSPDSQTSLPVTSVEAVDFDQDNFPAGTDCDDADDTVYPGAYEYCDFKDNDCDGEIDETWKIIWPEFYGMSCKVIADNDCVSYGTWVCDMDHDWLVCSAPPVRQAIVEKCNGLDDDCNGITDTDRWPELGTACSIVADACVMTGVWKCSDYGEAIQCSAEDLVPPKNCVATQKKSK